MARARGIVLFVTVAACAGPAGDSVRLPGGEGGIGFDDLRYSRGLGLVLAPAGRTGQVALIDPTTLAIKTIDGLSSPSSFDGSHDVGPTSIDEGHGFLFVTDRTAGDLFVVDPKTRTIVARRALSGGADYVRWVEPTSEVWVTEPDLSQIEVFAIGAGGAPDPRGAIHVDNGPESLVIDVGRKRAYTHRWQKETLAIDLASRATLGTWANGCAASRGIALDAERGLLITACSEGTATVLDVGHDGKLLSVVARGAGYDVIDYAPSLNHVYFAGTACACLVVMGLRSGGVLDPLGRMAATSSAHCVAADDRGNAWVCDPDEGRLLRVHDPFPASAR